MRRSRQGGGDDSLELLLDTICNVFGGIIFIAMLVAILTSAEANVVEESNAPSAITRESRLRELHQRAESLRLALVEVEAAAAVMRDAGAEQRAEEVEALRAWNEQAQRQLAELEAWLAAFDALPADAAATAEQRLEAARQAVSELKAQAAAAAERQVVRGRLPQERATKKRQVMFLLRGDRVHAIPQGGGAAALPPSRARDVAVREVTGGNLVTPRPGGGFAVAGDAGEAAPVLELLRHLDAGTHFFDFFVADDSVTVFQNLKSAAVHRGFEYRVTTVDRGEPLHLVSADEPLRTQ